MTRKPLSAIAALSLLTALLLLPGGVTAATPTDTTDLRDAVTVEGVRAHQAEFQQIADDNDGTRAAGTDGYQASGDYVAEQLDAAGYTVTIQDFSYSQFREFTPPEFDRVSPNPTTYTESTMPGDGNDFATMTYSGAGDVTAPVEAVDLALAPPRASTSGCEPEDFTDFTPGNVALIQRGTCAFAVKAVNAANADASAVIIFNQGNDVPDDDRFGVVFGTLGEPTPAVDGVPVLGTTFDIGAELAGLADPVVVHVAVDAGVVTTETFNVIADSTWGRTDRTVVVGAHLDSVREGPGINDNGSGSAAILEIAEQLADLGPTRNAVRFAFWGAEEDGLVGAQHYVDALTPRQRKNIALNLNFDMLGSPNFVRFVYDGDGDATGASGPNGSGRIEDVFLDYFDAQQLPTEPTAFDGRSDYGPFIAVGIPAGGLFSGAEGIKTTEQATVYGGTAGDAYDPCYHAACDTLANVSLDGLDQLTDAAAHAVLTFAQTTSAVNGTAQGGGNGKAEATMLGHQAIR